MFFYLKLLVLPPRSHETWKQKRLQNYYDFRNFASIPAESYQHLQRFFSQNFCRFNNNTTEYTGVVVIPESVTYHNKTYSVTSIGTSAFARSSNLISVTIPESVTGIGGSAFLGCRSLTDVYCYAPEPPSVSTTEYDGSWDGYPFDQNYIKEHTTLHVPASSLEKYKTALRWSDFCKNVPITGTSVNTIPFNGKSNYFDLQGRRLPQSQRTASTSFATRME